MNTYSTERFQHGRKFWVFGSIWYHRDNTVWPMSRLDNSQQRDHHDYRDYREHDEHLLSEGHTDKRFRS